MEEYLSDADKVKLAEKKNLILTALYKRISRFKEKILESLDENNKFKIKQTNCLFIYTKFKSVCQKTLNFRRYICRRKKFYAELMKSFSEYGFERPIDKTTD